MTRSLLFALLALALPATSLATSVNYSTKGSIAVGTATLSGGAIAGSSVTLTSKLVGINSVAAMGTISFTSGTLVATGNPNVFNFTGGTLTITNGTSTLFQGTFSSGTVTIMGNMSWSFAGVLNNGTVSLLDTHGDVSGNVLATPEPGTIAMLGTGLVSLGGLIFVRKRRSPSHSSNVRRDLNERGDLQI